MTTIDRVTEDHQLVSYSGVDLAQYINSSQDCEGGDAPINVIHIDFERGLAKITTVHEL